jgi:hypothetical protein
VDASVRVPRAAELPRPLQHRLVPALSGPGRRQQIPRAVVLPRPLQHAQVTGPSGERTTSLCPTCSRAPAPTATPLGARP